MIKPKWRIYYLVTIVFGLASVMSACGSGGGGGGGAANKATPLFEVDNTLQPNVSEITFTDGTGSRPVASVTDDLGNQIDFVMDEAIVALDDPADLDPLLLRLNATVLKEFDPKVVGASAGTPVFYLLKVAPGQADPAELAELIANSGGENAAHHRISSQGGLNILTAIADESENMGTSIGANFLLTYSGLSERSTADGPMANAGTGYNQNAFQWPYMIRGSVQDIGAAEAVRLVHDAGRVPGPGTKVQFMVMDGGFKSSADIPTPIFPGGSMPDVQNPYDCAGGNPCPWHGTQVASTAFSIFDDGIGGAGPAFEVVQPILVQSPNANFWDYVEYIFSTLPASVGRTPDIINISASGDIPAGLCLVGICTAVDIISSVAHSSGILVFASAGNDNANVDDEDCFIACWESFYRVPCEAPGVVCVGGMAHNTVAKDPASARGSEQRSSSGSVDIYAPFCTWVYDTVGDSNNALYTCGTSFSSPFAASIGALIKAANPSLGPNEIWSVMRDNAHTSSAGNVHRWLNAYGAVRAALGGNAPPFAQVQQPTEGASFSWNASNPPLVCNADDDGDAAGLTYSWSSSVNGAIGAASASTSAGPGLALGTHVITCTVSDGEFTAADSVTITIENDPPTLTISQPANGASFFSGQSINVSASAVDINGNLDSVNWAIVSGATTLWNGTGSSATIPAGTLAPGAYSLRAIAYDTLGAASSERTISLVINPDPVDLPPDISSPSITPTPSDDPNDNPPLSYFVDACLVDVNGGAAGNGWCQRLTFNATVSDDNDPAGALDYNWEVRESGVLVDTQSTGGASVNLDLIQGNYSVTLTVTDTNGHSSEHSWAFEVQTLI